jgi:molybdopterin synthase catalytic subunit
MVELTCTAIDANRLLAAVQSPHAGAVVLFLGTVRDRTGDARTLQLTYEAYEPMALLKLQAFKDDAHTRWPLQATAIVHRLGTVAVAETAVAVAVSAPHRAEAFAAATWLMDRVKEAVPIWKQDHAPGGATAWQDGAPLC